MNLKHVSLAMVAALAGGSVSLAGSDEAVFYLHLLHSNDGESQLVNAGSGQEDFGGVARFKTVADGLRAEAALLPNNAVERGVLLISSGDNILPGPEFNASVANGVPFFDTLAMELIGYDVACLGNHEFDAGPAVLADFIGGFSSPLTFVSANLDFTNEPNLQPLADSGKIARSTVVTVNDRLIGIIGATTPNLPTISSPGLTVVGQDVIGAIQTEIDALQLAGIDKIILSSHLQGIAEELDIIGSLSGVDVVIAGGGDELLANPGDLLIPGDTPFELVDDQGNVTDSGYPFFRNNADGISTPVVTTSGNYKYVGRVIIGFNAAGDVVEVLSESGPVRVSGIGEDAVLPDPQVQALVVEPVQDALDAIANNVVAVTDVPLDGIRANIRSVETNLGNLVADSILTSAREQAASFGAPQPVVAFSNGGGIRNDNIIPLGNVTELDTFNILPFSNFVTIVEDVDPLTLKRLAENAVSALGGGAGSGRFAQIAGFTMTIDPTQTPMSIAVDGTIVQDGSRVVELTLFDGTEIVSGGMLVEGAPTISVATVNFLANGGDQYPFGGRPFTIVGSTYQQALQNYLSTNLSGVVSAGAYPVGGEGRIRNLTNGDAPYCSADLDGSGSVDLGDLNSVLAAFGQNSLVADTNGDFVVDLADLNTVLSQFGQSCPE
jgi:5'-nucleotidase